MSDITIQGARTHNLKNIDVVIPRDKLVVITGLSGSGKSSLAFDTLYAEGQRRYVESLSAYARQFLSMMEKPDVDSIEGLSPAISIEQKSTSHNPRSTVGTVTEIYDYLRLLFARVGEPHCPSHNVLLKSQSVSQMVDTVLSLDEGKKVMILAPVVRDRKGEHIGMFDKLQSQGYVRVRIDGIVYDIDSLPPITKNQKHSIDVVVDRIKVRDDLKSRLAESFDNALNLSEGLAIVACLDGVDDDPVFSANFACPECGYSLQALEPRLFSFNNPVGACRGCDGLGVKQVFDPERVIHNGSLSLAGGAIRGWDRTNVYYFSLLNSIAEHYGIDVETPYRQLPKNVQQDILYGSGTQKIEITYHRLRGGIITKNQAFEGVIPNMQRRYKETDSNLVREELIKYMTTQPCPNCDGARLCTSSRNVFIEGKAIQELTALSIEDAQVFFESLNLPGNRGEIASKILKEIVERLGFLNNVGLDYLSLDRSAETLSGGEGQRIRLASQIGSGLVGVMYILDEPSIGLHQRDNDRLLQTLIHLRDLGNSVIVVEHDEDAIRAADYVFDIGPGAGVHGGEIVAKGTIEQIKQSPSSLTGQYLSGKLNIEIPKLRRAIDHTKILTLEGVTTNNLRSVKLKLPLGVMTCITGVSGSGKSSLINDTLYPLAATQLNHATTLLMGNYQDIQGLELLDKVIDIDQSPIGRTPRSNPATYTGLFTPIRELFAATPEARLRGYKAGRFSFNVKGGRCESCSGDGLIKVEMHFLPDVYVNCDVCHGKRYNRETLDIHYKGKTIDDILKMTVEVGRDFFEAVPALKRKLDTLMAVGLSYITLGQSATTLSGGEAQRIKLARELSKRSTGKTLYILDEPTTGLHFHDIKQLLVVLERLKEGGNTIVIIEHNLDVIKTADWIIDLGPEGGAKGGLIIGEGTPEEIAKLPNSYTGQFLAPMLKEHGHLKIPA